jgi:hypothetical protein
MRMWQAVTSHAISGLLLWTSAILECKVAMFHLGSVQVSFANVDSKPLPADVVEHLTTFVTKAKTGIS